MSYNKTSANLAQNILIGSAEITIGSNNIGWTQGGTTVRYEPEYVDVDADQAAGIVRKSRSLERLYVETTILETTLDDLKLAFMVPDSSYNSATSTLTLGYDDTCWMDEYTLTLVGPGPGAEAGDCGTRTWTFSRAVSFGTREYGMMRDTATTFAVQFEILKDSSGNFGTVVDS